MKNLMSHVVWIGSCLISCALGATTFVTTPHIFMSPNFPSTYPDIHKATWNFETEPNQSLLLRFVEIRTEQVFDFISVGDGTYPTNYRRLLRWSGEDNNQELAVLSNGNKLWMTFQTDSFSSYPGFNATVEQVTAENIQDICNCTYRCGSRVCLTKKDICDGLINCEDGADENCKDTVFVDSKRDLDSIFTYTKYPDNYRFTWYFETDPGFQLLIEFDFIKTKRNDDFVTIGEGHNVSLNRLLTWSDDSKGKAVQVVSTNNLLWMTLSTDERSSDLSLSGNITKINVTQEGWKCSSNSFRCSEKVCIPRENQCDETIQCPDGEDERVCPYVACSHDRVCSEGTCSSWSGKCSDYRNECRQPKYGCSGSPPDPPSRVPFGNLSYILYIDATDSEKRLVVSFQLYTREYQRFSLTIEEGQENSEIFSLRGSQVPPYVITAHSMRRSIRMLFTSEGGLYVKVVELTAAEFDCGTINLFQCSPGICIPREHVSDGKEDCPGGIDEGSFQTSTETICKECIVTEELKRIAETNLTRDNVLGVAQELEEVSRQVDIVSAENVESIIGSLENIIQVNASADQVINITDSVVAIANNIIDVSSGTLKLVTDIARVPILLEAQATNLHLNGHNYSEIQENVGMSTIQIHEPTVQSNVTFGTFTKEEKLEDDRDDSFRLSGENTGFRERFEQLQPRAAITIPGYILISNEKGKQNSSTIPLSFLVYRDATLFPVKTNMSAGKESRGVISSHVISATVAIQNVTVHNLPKNSLVIVKFYSPKEKISTSADENEERSCVYWKYNATLGWGEWDTYGCKMVQSVEHYVTCLCNHLTSFAVLVHVTKEPYTSSPILDFVSVIGRILSIIGLSICVVTSLAIKEIRRKQLTQIHINLSIALIALYATFSIGIKSTRDDVRCQITASLIHFFCFSSMAWMSVEAINMFVFFWTLRRDNIKHLLLIGSLFAWGFPFIVSTTVYLLDETIDYRGVSYCFLQPGIALYIGFLLPILLLFIFNCVIFVLITYRVSCRKIIAANEEARRKAEVARIKGPILFWVLLGLSWMFGFLAIFNTSIKVLFEILFSVCLSFQGVFMFYMLTLNNPEIKTKLKRFRQGFERSITSQLHLLSFTSDQQVEVTVES